MSAFADALRREIADGGPMPLADYMARANAHYYATRDPIGVGGDFITAPEISQMFGELLGLWCADLWLRAGQPPVHLVELGPGRGTLMADMRRAFARFPGLAETPPLFVETSPALRACQKERHPDARWHDDVTALPDDRPLLIVANEFFDALPIVQHVLTAQGWRLRMVGLDHDRLSLIAGDAVCKQDFTADIGAIVEHSPASIDVMQALASRLAVQGGALLAIDYGYAGPAVGDTFQAVRGHRFADPLEAPGDSDLTAHVDFAALADAARKAGAVSLGPIIQADLLRALGIDQRATALARSNPDRAGALAAQRDRLLAPDQMGTLFKALAITAPGWPRPTGF